MNKMPLMKRKKTSFGAFLMRKRGTVTGAMRRRRGGAMFRKPGLRARALLKYNVHSYKRMATAVNYTMSSGATAFNNSFAMTLSDVRNSGELTALYDQYMITGVKITFQLIVNPDASQSLNSGTINNSNNFYPKLFFVRDYDDIGVEATNDIRERNNVQTRILRPNQNATFFIRPAVRNQLYLDGVTAANSPVWRQWLDCSSSNVPHYGCKFSVDFLGVTPVQDSFIRVEKTYYLKFKNAR